tara:strand:- start:132 stop:476 length:345 start_codon:yes stop_codon:yes gene_type:complete
MDVLSVEDKRKYIFSVSSSIIYTKEIRDLIEEKSIKITENINGIFINLSLLSDNIIVKLYSIIIEQKEQYENKPMIEEKIVNITPIKIKKLEKKKEYKKIQLTRLQRAIIKSIL